MKHLIFFGILFISAVGLCGTKEDVYDVAYRQVANNTKVGHTPTGAQCTFSVTYTPTLLEQTLEEHVVYAVTAMRAKITVSDVSMVSFFSEYPKAGGGRGDCATIQADEENKFKMRNMTDLCASPRGHHGALGMTKDPTTGIKTYSIWGKDDVLLGQCSIK